VNHSESLSNLPTAAVVAQRPANYTRPASKSQLTQTEPRDALHRARPIGWYTKLVAEYDKQATVVGRLLTTVDYGGDPKFRTELRNTHILEEAVS